MMGVLECASGASTWRGYDYYKEKKVLSIKQSEDGGILSGAAHNAFGYSSVSGAYDD